MGKKKRNKMQKLVILLKKEPFTTDELIEKTQLSKGTIDLLLNYDLKKQGYEVVKSNKLGHLAYQIIGEPKC